MKQIARSALILFCIGTFVSVQQASSEEIVDIGERELALTRWADAGAGYAAEAEGRFLSAGADTLETFDIELEEENGGNLYKEIAVVAIVTAMVGYMVLTLLDEGDEEEESTSGGKDVPGPFIGLSVPFSP